MWEDLLSCIRRRRDTRWLSSPIFLGTTRSFAGRDCALRWQMQTNTHASNGVLHHPDLVLCLRMVEVIVMLPCRLRTLRLR